MLGWAFFKKKNFPLLLFNENMYVLTKRKQEKKSCYPRHEIELSSETIHYRKEIGRKWHEQWLFENKCHNFHPSSKKKPDNFDYFHWPSWVSTWNSKLDKENGQSLKLGGRYQSSIHLYFDWYPVIAKNHFLCREMIFFIRRDISTFSYF